MIPRAPMKKDKKNGPNIEPVPPNGFCMKLLNARKIGTNDKKKRRNPMPANVIPTCRSRGPDSPNSVALAGHAVPGPPTMLPLTDFDRRSRDERLRGTPDGKCRGGESKPGPPQGPAAPRAGHRRNP